MLKKSIVESLKDNYMPYSAHVILQRALPEIDGFKPSQRRVLYTMFKMGLLKGNRTKSANVVGQGLKLNPHGDQSLYETAIRLAKDHEALLIPFIDSKGNFGKYYSRDMQPAAMRYTEMRLEKISQELFKDIDKNVVDMIDNYDNTMKEPRLLPVTFPTILANPTQGTAVSMGSSICSFNLNELIDLTINFIKNRNVNVSDYIKAPDFPSGGVIVYDEKEFQKIYETGKGSFKIRAKYEFDGNSIIIKEIPYTTKIEVIIEKIADLVKEGKLKEITDINDMEGVNSKGIQIVVKNNTDKELLMKKLFKLTPLEDTFSCNFNVIVSGKPKVLGIKDILLEWVKFRAKCIKRGMQYDLDKKKNKRHLLLGLEKVLLDIDKAIKIIRETKNDEEMIANLMQTFNIDQEQAEYIAEIKLRHLNKEYIIQRINEIEELTKEINHLEFAINDKITIAKIIIDQLEYVKKTYGQPRRTEIIYADELPSVDEKEIEIENYNVRIVATKQGYLKKIPLTSLRGSSNMKLKDDDEITYEFDATNKSDILVFTNKQNCYKLKAYEIDDHKPSVLGEYLPSTLGLKDENIVYVTATEDYEGYLIIGLDNGKVAKIELSSYKSNRSMLKNAYTDQEKPIYFDTIKNDVDLVAVSTINKVMVFNTNMINPKTSKTTIGVQVMKSKNDSKVKLIKRLENVQLQDVDYYRTSNAAVGKYLKKGDII
jgi:DNA gyrase subunit A